MFNLFALFLTLTQDLLHIHTWRDYAEILFFVVLVYTLLLWLRKDMQKNLIFYFYGYCSLMVVAHTLNLSSMSFILLNGLPACILLFFTIHQETLQKNFIALQTINPLITQDTPWLEELMRISLSALNKKRDLLIIIERKDSLAACLTAPYLINADLKKGLLDLFLEVGNPDEPITLWVTDSGKLIASPVTWNFSPDEEWITPTAKHIPAWKQNGILITQKKDALIIHLACINRSFDLLLEGKIIEQLTAPQLFTIIKQTTIKKVQGKQYGSTTTKNSYHEINS